jgi:hypothetical protein
MAVSHVHAERRTIDVSSVMFVELVNKCTRMKSGNHAENGVRDGQTTAFIASMFLFRSSLALRPASMPCFRSSATVSSFLVLS